MPWQIAQSRDGSDTTSYEWELYHLEDDFSQSKNLADTHPGKLAELQALFEAEAHSHNVYPIHDTGARARVIKMIRTPGSEFEMVTQRTLWGPDISLSMFAAPNIFSLPFTIEAEIEIPQSGAQGVMLAAGSQFGGWSFYLVNGAPVAVASISPLPGGFSRVGGGEPLSPGRHVIRYDFEHDETGGTLVIEVDGEAYASGQIENRPHIMAGGGETLDSGLDNNGSVSTEYQNGGRFTGEIIKIDVSVNLPLWQKALLKLKETFL